MKGIWKDGRVKFRRDNNVSMRGIYGREPGVGSASGRFSWCEMLSGKGRSDARRAVHKGFRRTVQAEIESQLSAEEAQRIEEEALWLKEYEEWAEYWMIEDIIREEREREERDLLEFERAYYRGAYEEDEYFDTFDTFDNPTAVGEW